MEYSCSKVLFSKTIFDVSTTEHNNLIEFAADTIAGLWKKVGGPLKQVAAIGICIFFAVLFLIALGFPDYFLMKVLMADMGPVNAPFASPLSFMRFAYLSTSTLTMFVGLDCQFAFVANFVDEKVGCARKFRGAALVFATPFIGMAAQIADYTSLTAVRMFWRLINGHAPGCYELYILLLVAGKAAYLFWLNSQYAAFLKAKKQAAEDDAEAENVAHAADEVDKQDEGAAEENDQSKEDAEESNRNAEHVEPEVASESGSTDWEMD
ncbi:hypothetical protein AAVH_20542 [Aphelenchoides avenae]|nr:hypothetical protein AAVH_20542 [Aphelenchus avenae]